MKSREALVEGRSEYYTYSPSVQAKESLLYPLSIGNFYYQPGYDLYRTSFDSFLLEVILEGSVTVETEGLTLRANPGDAVLVDCYQPHRYHSATGWHALWLHFDGVSARGYYNIICRSKGHVFPAAQAAQRHNDLKALYEMFHGEAALNELQLALHLTQVLTQMAMLPAQPQRTETQGAGMDTVIYHINTHLQQELPVRELAKLANFSEYHFIRLFRELIGMTPRQYIITVRMDHAKYLLKTTSLPVQEVGYAIGYASESMFCTTFKRSQGMTPSEYRTGALPPG